MVDTIILIFGAIVFLYGLYAAFCGFVTIFKTLKKNDNTVGIVLMILFTVVLPMVAIIVAAFYDVLIDDGSSLKEE